MMPMDESKYGCDALNGGAQGHCVVENLPVVVDVPHPIFPVTRDLLHARGQRGGIGMTVEITTGEHMLQAQDVAIFHINYALGLWFTVPRLELPVVVTVFVQVGCDLLMLNHIFGIEMWV